jgi:DNA-binding MarR family transcriptional regulator
LVRITEHGQELCSSVNNVWQNLDKEIFNVLTDEEQDILRNLLERVRANLLDTEKERNSEE